MSKDLGNNTNWHANVSRRAANLCRNMCRWPRVTFSVSRRFFFNTRLTFHCGSVLRGENEAFPSAADVFAEGIHSLGRNRNTSDCVHRLRSLTLAASQGLMSAIEFFERVDVTQGTYR